MVSVTQRWETIACTVLKKKSTPGSQAICLCLNLRFFGDPIFSRFKDIFRKFQEYDVFVLLGNEGHHTPTNPWNVKKTLRNLITFPKG